LCQYCRKKACCYTITHHRQFQGQLALRRSWICQENDEQVKCECEIYNTHYNAVQILTDIFYTTKWISSNNPTSWQPGDAILHIGLQ
jgi:hypothetical protein